MIDAVVIAHAAFTFAMLGLIVTVQLVVYPQFRSVDAARFGDYVENHARGIVAALAVFAPIEVVLAAWLWVDPHPAIGRTAPFVAGVLLALAWVSTGAWFAPLHGRLGNGHDPAGIELLIRTNWARTLLWIARAFFAAWFLWKIVE